MKKICLAIITTLCLSACSSGEAVKTEVSISTPIHTTTLDLEYPTTISPDLADRFSALALACVHQEFPNKISRTTDTAEEIGRPKELFPAFYGCFDWHSSVHGHWLLVRLLRVGPQDAPW